MALTETQKTRARMYLGYERGFDVNSRLESKLVSLSAEEETELGGVLTQLAAVDAKIAAVATSTTPQVKRVDEIEFRDGDPLAFHGEFYRHDLMTPFFTPGREAIAAVVATRHAARRDVATARTALEIVQAMHAMTEATPWQPGDVELDDELELVAGAVHLLARRAVERRRELEENPLRHVGSAAAELAEIRRRFGINVAALLTEGTES